MNPKPTPGAPDGAPTTTLGDLLDAERSRVVPEDEWVGLVRSIAGGDRLALRQLYERTHRLVFTLAMRISRSRESAERLASFGLAIARCPYADPTRSELRAAITRPDPVRRANHVPTAPMTDADNPHRYEQKDTKTMATNPLPPFGTPPSHPHPIPDLGRTPASVPAPPPDPRTVLEPRAIPGAPPGAPPWRQGA